MEKKYDPHHPTLGVPQEEVDALRHAVIGQEFVDDFNAETDDITALGRDLEDAVRENKNMLDKSMENGTYGSEVHKQGLLKIGEKFRPIIRDEMWSKPEYTEGVAHWARKYVNKNTMGFIGLLNRANVPGSVQGTYIGPVCNENDEANTYAMQLCEKYGIDLREGFLVNTFGDGERKIINCEPYTYATHVPVEVVNQFIKQDAEELNILEKQGITLGDLIDRMRLIIVNAGRGSYNNDLIPEYKKVLRRPYRLACPLSDCEADFEQVGDVHVEHKETGRNLRLNSTSLHLIEAHGIWEKQAKRWGDNSQMYPESPIDFARAHMPQFVEEK